MVVEPNPLTGLNHRETTGETKISVEERYSESENDSLTFMWNLSKVHTYYYSCYGRGKVGKRHTMVVAMQSHGFYVVG